MTETWFNEDSATFGDRLVAAREAAGLTAAQLASHVGVRVKTLENWESDRSEPRANRAQMLAGVLNVSIVWLLTGRGEGGIDPALATPESDGDLLRELREIGMLQHQLADRLARVEKRLRAGRA